RKMWNLIVNSGARSEHCFALAPRIPGNTDAGSKVVVISVIRRLDVDAHLFQADGRIKISDQVVVFLDDAIELVAQAKVDAETRSYTPIVRHEPGIGPQVNTPARIADKDLALAGVSSKKILQRVAERETGCRAAKKLYASLPPAV